MGKHKKINLFVKYMKYKSIMQNLLRKSDINKEDRNRGHTNVLIMTDISTI
jgi:hypothetical protein